MARLAGARGPQDIPGFTFLAAEFEIGYLAVRPFSAAMAAFNLCHC